MKAYKLIWKLLRHPFAKVQMRGERRGELIDYDVAEAIYNDYTKDYLLNAPIDTKFGLIDPTIPTVSGCCDTCNVANTEKSC